MATTSDTGFPPDIAPDAYIVERELGRGGMATVYVARDAKHRRRVALKVLRRDLAASLGAERFRREITLAASLQHPHIVAVYDSGETPSGVLWFTMPLIEGQSLRDRMRRQRQLPIEDALRITREVALALDYAHRHGVIHRDVKPENILLVDGQAMVADFGIARPTTRGAPGETLTATGMAIGTPAYMSPEQAAGEREVDAATDIYSLGVVLYEMLAGEPPYAGPTAQAIAAKMMAGDVPSVRRTRPSVPQAVDAALRKSLSPVPADRFATAAAFANALDTAERTASAQMGSPTAAAVSRNSASRHRVAAGATVLGFAILIGAGFLFTRRAHERSVTQQGSVRIAVLPFDNLGDSADDYFADGVTDAVRGKLTAVPGLDVTAPVSSSLYRRTTKSPQQVGRELGVRYLLTGRVRWAKVPGGTSRVQVNSALIDATTASDKWEAPFDAPITDVFQVQADIATRVVRELQVALAPHTEQTIARQPTHNIDAYDAFLRGQAIEAAHPGDSRAVAAYAQAARLDSTYAGAWAALAHVHLIATLQEYPQAAEHTQEALVAAERALAIAPDLADAHAALGLYYALGLGDLQRGLPEYEKGRRLDPSNASLLRGTAVWEWIAGQHDSALVHSERAAQLDPRNADILVGLCDEYRAFGRYRDAQGMCDRALALQPTNVLIVEHRAFIPLEQGDLAGARAVISSALATIDSGTVAAYFAEVDELGWVLDTALERVLLRQRISPDLPADRGTWMCVLAQQYGYRGDSLRARAYADSASAAYSSILRRIIAQPGKTPPNTIANLHAFDGLSLAYLGRRDSALAHARLAVAMSPSEPYFKFQLAKAYVLLDRPDDAIQLLELLVTQPAARVEQVATGPAFTPGYVRLDRNFTRLHGNPRFERLIAQAATPPIG